MKKKLLITMMVLMLTVAAAAAMTTATQHSMKRVYNNFVTIGKVIATECDPSPLVQQGPMALGKEYTWNGTLTPKGDINQDLYAGLCDSSWQPPGTLGNVVQYKLYSSRMGWVTSEWTGVHDLFVNWKKLASNVSPDDPVGITIKLRLNPDIDDYTDYMGIKHWFEVLIFAVNTGGSAPSSAPYTFTAYTP